MKRTYTVKRFIREEYEVEIDSDTLPTREQIKAAAVDPYAVIVLRETVRAGESGERG
jgi:hypothetical protein